MPTNPLAVLPFDALPGAPNWLADSRPARAETTPSAGSPETRQPAHVPHTTAEAPQQAQQAQQAHDTKSTSNNVLKKALEALRKQVLQSPQDVLPTQTQQAPDASSNEQIPTGLTALQALQVNQISTNNIAGTQSGLPLGQQDLRRLGILRSIDAAEKKHATKPSRHDKSTAAAVRIQEQAQGAHDGTGTPTALGARQNFEHAQSSRDALPAYANPPENHSATRQESTTNTRQTNAARSAEGLTQAIQAFHARREDRANPANYMAMQGKGQGPRR